MERSEVIIGLMNFLKTERPEHHSTDGKKTGQRKQTT